MTVKCTLCEDPLSSKARMAMCQKCRAHMGRWRHRSLREQSKRMENLALYSVRMSVLVDIPKKGPLAVEDGSTAIEIARKRYGQPSKVIQFSEKKKHPKLRSA